MRLPNTRQFGPNGLVGYQVELVAGDIAPDGDAVVDQINFAALPVGSSYWRKVTDNQVEYVLKVKDDNRDDDYEILMGIIKQRVAYTDFTDGGSTSGTKDLNASIPAGVIVERTSVTNITGFTNDTSATLIVGVTGGDIDRYNTGTPSVFTTATQGVDMGVPSGTKWHTAAATPTLLITTATDFTLVNAGALTVSIHYYGSRP
jgi:hypothetical protein